MIEQTFSTHNIRVHKDLESSQDTSIRLFPLVQRPGEEKINSITIFGDSQIAIGPFDRETEFPSVQNEIKNKLWIGLYCADDEFGTIYLIKRQGQLFSPNQLCIELRHPRIK